MQKLYTVELPGLALDDGRNVVRRERYTLYLEKGNSVDAPGIAIFAQVDDLKPGWDWEEFQSWPSEKKASAFGDYYDKKHPTVSVIRQSACRLQVETFDQRESAQDLAYGAWLRPLLVPEPAVAMHPRGLVVSIPIHECESAFPQLWTTVQSFTISVSGFPEVEPETIEIELRLGVVGTWIKVLGRSFEIN